MRQFRALVIDDMDFCRELLSDFFKERGYQVVCFPDVSFCPLYKKTKGSCFQQGPCADFLLTDNQMPRMKGVDFLTLQKKNNCHLCPEQKAIFSANWNIDDLEQAERLNCKTFEKPFSLSDLEAWLAEQEQKVSRQRPLTDINLLKAKR